MEQAEAWLGSGAKVLSKFGRRCVITQLSASGIAPRGQYPVQLGHEIYFLGTSELRAVRAPASMHPQVETD